MSCSSRVSAADCSIVRSAGISTSPGAPTDLVGLANQPVMSPERLRGALARRAAALADGAAVIRRAADAQPHAPRFVRAIFDYSSTSSNSGGYPPRRADRSAERRGLAYDPLRHRRAKNSDWVLVDVPAPVHRLGAATRTPARTTPPPVEALYAVASDQVRQQEQARPRLRRRTLWWADDPGVRAKDLEMAAAHQPASVARWRQAGRAGEEGPLRYQRCPWDTHHVVHRARTPTACGCRAASEIYLSDRRRTDPAKLKTSFVSQ